VRWVNLGIIAIALFVIYKMSTNKKFTQKLTSYLKKKILKKEFFKPVSFEELLLLTGGYGITKLEVTEGNSLIDKTLAESELKTNDITILTILRDNNTTPNPPANMKILLNDELICFGKLENIKNRI
jgi:K+/H+ antiporter YhaU regulatory subunit KhtT